MANTPPANHENTLETLVKVKAAKPVPIGRQAFRPVVGSY
jgi:hypothetical protein